MPTNQNPVPPPVFSGFDWNPFKSNLNYLYDSTIGPSGAYRALRASDFTSVFSGEVNISDSIWATGKFIPTSAISGFQSGASGAPAGPVYAAENNALVVLTPNLDKTADSVSAYPPRGATLNTGGVQGAITTMGTVFPANPNRNVIFIQNQNTGLPLLVSLSGSASVINWNFTLKPASSIDFGDGGSWSSDSWLGSVSVSGSGQVRFSSFEY